MAKFTRFGYNQYGDLVYRNTGRSAPSSYTVRGSTVYGSDGRKVGQIGKGTKAQQQTMRKAATAGGRKASPTKPSRFSFKNIRKARERALREIPGTRLVKPAMSRTEVKNFGKSVKNMALLSIKNDPSAYAKIRQMSNDKLAQLFREDQMIFDVYFDYGGVTTENGKGVTGNAETAKNANALIKAYEERYGSIAVQSTL